MRALDITIFAIAVLALPSMFGGLGMFNPIYTGCDAEVCQVQTFLYDMADMQKIQPLDLSTTNPVDVGWDIVMFSVTFVAFAFFWMIYILSLVVIVAPALVVMFHVPQVFANYMNIFYWLLWMLAVIQYKRGGFSVDTYK